MNEDSRYMGCLNLYKWPVEETTLVYYIYDKLNFGTPEVFDQNIHYFATLQDNVDCIQDRIDLAFSGLLQWCDVAAEPLRKAGFKNMWKNPKYKTEAERKCIKLQRSMYFAVFVICFWEKLKHKNPYKHCISQEQFMCAYPQFVHVAPEESVKLVSFRNVVSLTKRLSGLFYCKEVVMDLIPRISEGHAYTTGGGAGVATKRRYEIFELETARTKKPHALRSRHQHQVVDDDCCTFPVPLTGQGNVKNGDNKLDILLQEVQKEAPVMIPGVNGDKIKVVGIENNSGTETDVTDSDSISVDSNSNATKRQLSSLDILTSAIDIEISKKKHEDLEAQAKRKGNITGLKLAPGTEENIKGQVKRQKKCETGNNVDENPVNRLYPYPPNPGFPGFPVHPGLYGQNSMYGYGFQPSYQAQNMNNSSGQPGNSTNLNGFVRGFPGYIPMMAGYEPHMTNNPNFQFPTCTNNDGNNAALNGNIQSFPQNVASNLQSMQMFYHIQQQAAAMAMQLYPHRGMNPNYGYSGYNLTGNTVSNVATANEGRFKHLYPPQIATETTKTVSPISVPSCTNIIGDTNTRSKYSPSTAPINALSGTKETKSDIPPMLPAH